jgi:nucleotide-binding universal stress UspA family protein
MFSRILVPIDGGEPALRAVRTAAELAGRDGAALALLTVVDVELAYSAEAGVLPTDLLASLRREARSFLTAASLALPAGLQAAELLREGWPADEIIAAAREWGADLIVLGAAARSGLARLLPGGTVATVTRRAPCPVLVVRAAAATEARPAGGWRRLLHWAPS